MTKNKSSTESASTIVSSPPLKVHQVGGSIGDGISPSKESSVDPAQTSVTSSQHQSSPPAYLVVFLQSLSELGELFWDHGEMGAALLNADFSIHTDFGTIHTPCPDIGWKSGRLLAGTIVPGAVSPEGNREFHLFYGGSPGGDGLLTEEIALAKLTITASGRLEWEDLKTVELLGWEKYYDYSTHPEKPEITHRQKRDPFVVFHDGLYWMFTSAATRTTSDIYRGCVGLAVSDHVEGPYKAVRSPFFPHFLTADGEEGICYDCERPHVFFHDDHWHLFFSARKPLTKLHLVQGDGAPLNDSSLHYYRASRIQGPYLPISNRPIVEGSTETGLYGINFIAPDDDKVLAYGFDNEKMMLDVTGSWEVLWPNGHPVIKPHHPTNVSTAHIRNLLTKPGYQLWDATMLRLT